MIRWINASDGGKRLLPSSRTGGRRSQGHAAEVVAVVAAGSGVMHAV